MTATNKVLNVSQIARLGQLLHEATTGFKEKVFRATGNVPTDAEITAFSTKVTPSISASILKADSLSSGASREDRLNAVKTTAALAGVKFAHRRDTEEVEVNYGVSRATARGYIEHSEIEVVNATRGGQTLAFKYRLDADNNLSIDYTTAFCRADENFDPLIGMEESLKKFQAGRVLNTPVTHERFGEVKLDQLTDAYKAAENEGKAYLAEVAAQAAAAA